MVDEPNTVTGPAPDDDGIDQNVDPHEFDGAAFYDAGYEEDQGGQGSDSDEPDYDPIDRMSRSELAELEAQARYEQEQYEEDLIRAALQNIQTDAVKTYLGSTGDAVDKRINALLSEAKQLLGTGHPGPALVLAGTALEITTRFMLLHRWFKVPSCPIAGLQFWRRTLQKGGARTTERSCQRSWRSGESTWPR
jgi:hypothetical protein